MKHHTIGVVALSLSLAGALGCAATSHPGAQARTTAAAPAKRVVPQNDHAAAFEQMDRVAMQIVRGTAKVPEPQYQRRVKPRLRGQLLMLGFAERQADQILARVDGARADRANVRRWWAARWGRPSAEMAQQQAGTPRSPRK